MTGERGLLDVATIRLPKPVALDAISALKRAGADGDEGFVLLGGTFDDGSGTLTFSSAYWPDQTPRHTPSGLLVEVGGEALHRANLAFHHRGEIMAGQVHSHPTDAYHSELDDHLPLVTLLGAVSIVVPDFGAAGLAALDRWACYRLTGPGEWRRTTRGELEVIP